MAGFMNLGPWFAMGLLARPAAHHYRPLHDFFSNEAEAGRIVSTLDPHCRENAPVGTIRPGARFKVTAVCAAVPLTGWR